MLCVLQFDSGIQRFMSMRATEYDHFRPTTKTTMYGLGLVVIPIIAYAYLLKSTRVRYSWYQTSILKEAVVFFSRNGG
jgi:homogentisate 1,2-dioxygenase